MLRMPSLNQRQPHQLRLLVMLVFREQSHLPDRANQIAGTLVELVGRH